MQKCMKICKNLSKYAENMQKKLIFAWFIVFWKSYAISIIFKPNLYFCVKYANMQNSGLY